MSKGDSADVPPESKTTATNRSAQGEGPTANQGAGGPLGCTRFRNFPSTAGLPSGHEHSPEKAVLFGTGVISLGSWSPSRDKGIVPAGG